MTDEPGRDDAPHPDVAVVIATRDRAAELCRTLGRLTALPERPDVIVVDNASRDQTATAVRRQYPQVELIRLSRNLKACGRNVGARHARTAYVAFSDDDSWWEPGALRRACDLLAAHADLSLVAGHTLIGPRGIPDPINAAMAASPLPRGPLPGPRVLGFLGCAAVVRRAPFLAVGGYSPILGIGAEEGLLALDLAAAGWASAYCADVVAWHQPSPARDVGKRRYLLARNQVITAWLRRPPRRAARATLALARNAARDPAARRGLAGLAVMLPRVLAARRKLPAATEQQAALLELAAHGSAASTKRR